MNSLYTHFKMFCVFIVPVTGTVTISWAQWALPPLDTSEPFVQRIPSHSGVAAIKQLRFEFDFGYVRDSDWGEICIDPLTFSQITGMDSGYLNLCIMESTRVGTAAPIPRLKWIIQNMCIPKALVDTCALQMDAMNSMDPMNGMEPMSMPILSAYFDLMPSERL